MNTKKIQKLAERLEEELTVYVNNFATDKGLTPEQSEEILSNIGQTILLATIADIVETIPEGEDREAIVAAINEGEEEIFDKLTDKYKIDFVKIMENNAKKTMTEVFK